MRLRAVGWALPYTRAAIGNEYSLISTSAAEKARGPQRLYEVRVDGKPLRIAVKSGQVTVPSSSPKEPNVVVETGPEVMSQLLTGALDVDDAIASGRVSVDGDRAEARRLFEMFRFPSPEDARV